MDPTHNLGAPLGMSIPAEHPAAGKRDERVRRYPYPFSAWLALSSDPDNTLIEDWQELDRVIWKELALPFADTLFVRSYNLNLPEQVDLYRNPHILAAHAHDSIHTWGDYVWSGPKSFERVDAIEARETLARHGFRPRVWVDHSIFMGNMLHNHRYGGMPTITDASGHVYPNPLYTLDIVKHVGVRYLWDGTITPVLGQDRSLNRWEMYRERSASKRAALSNLLKHRTGQLLGVGKAFREQYKDNKAYHLQRFPDGNVFYTFQRYGTWQDADIDGLGRLLAPEKLDELLRNKGTCILYTHLGKRPVDRMHEQQHIPESTLNSLRYVRDKWKARQLQLSSVSKLMDYLVLRDHLTMDEQQEVIRFHADGIAFHSVDAADLTGHSFSFAPMRVAPSRWKVTGTSGVLAPRIEDHGKQGFTLHFGA